MVTHPLEEEYFEKTTHYKRVRRNRFDPEPTEEIVNELCQHLSDGRREDNGNTVVVRREIDDVLWSLVVGYDNEDRHPVLVTVYSEYHEKGDWDTGMTGRYMKRRNKRKKRQQNQSDGPKYSVGGAD